MAGRSNKVEESVHAVVSKSRITFDSGFFGKDVVVLALKMANDFRKTSSYCVSINFKVN